VSRVIEDFNFYLLEEEEALENENSPNFGKKHQRKEKSPFDKYDNSRVRKFDDPEEAKAWLQRVNADNK
jgi:hypothetical protein